MSIIDHQLLLCLNKLQQWATDNGFRFSKTKKRGVHLDPQLFRDKSPISAVEIKYLGVIFDKRLSFVPHLKYVKQNHTNILKVISNTEWVSKLDINKTMDALCMGQLVSLTLYMLDPVHNHGLGLCLGAFRTSVRELVCWCTRT